MIDEDKIKKQVELIVRVDELTDTEVRKVLKDMSHRLLVVDVFWEALELSINWVKEKEMKENDQDRRRSPHGKGNDM